MKFNFFVTGNDTRIGQHFTFTDELHIFDDRIWQGNAQLVLTPKRINREIRCGEISSSNILSSSYENV